MQTIAGYGVSSCLRRFVAISSLLKIGIAISLLLTLGCPLVGTRVFLLLRKSEIKESVKERILAGVDKNEQVRLVFSKEQVEKDLHWEHSREFEYQGEMYDVLESEIRGDSLVYWCIWDRAETMVNRQLEALTSLATGNDPPSQNCIQQLFDFLKNMLPGSVHGTGVGTTAYLSSLPNYQVSSGTNILTPPTPPPQLRRSA